MLQLLVLAMPAVIIFVLNYYWFGKIDWVDTEPLNRLLFCSFAFVASIGVGLWVLRRLSRHFLMFRSYVSLALLAVLIVGVAPLKQTHGPDGDAPHYAIAAMSIAVDGDLLTDENYVQWAHAPYFRENVFIWEMPDRREDTNVDGERQFWPSIGVPVLIAPFSRFEPQFFVPLAFSLLLFLALSAVWLIGGNRAEMDWWRVGLYASCPVVAYTSQYFPDPFGFCFIGLALYDVVVKKAYVRATLWLAILPWLKPYLGVFSVSIFVAMLLTMRSESRQFAKLALIPLVSFVAMAAYNWTSWNTILLPPVYGVSYETKLSHLSFEGYFINLGELFLGLKAGILWCFPVFFLPWFRIDRIRNLGAPLILSGVLPLLLMFWLATVSHVDGGWCPRARYLIPFLGFALILVDRSRGTMFRPLIGASFIMSLPGFVFAQGGVPWGGLSNPFGVVTYVYTYRWWKTEYPGVLDSFIAFLRSFREIQTPLFAFFLLAVAFSILRIVWVAKKRSRIPNSLIIDPQES